MNELRLIYQGKEIAVTEMPPKEITGRVILFLYGGSKTKGKERFNDWQKSLHKEGVGSVSFDFTGMGQSLGVFSESSLNDRISQAVFISEWIQKRYPQATLSLYGVSMGGFIALGTCSTLPLFKKIILQCPAAYSDKAEDLPFDHSFTAAIQGTWRESRSFQWFKEFPGDTLLIYHEHDEVVRREITDSYEEIGKQKPSFTSVMLKNAPHGIWKDDPQPIMFRELTYAAIIKFLTS